MIKFSILNFLITIAAGAPAPVPSGAMPALKTGDIVFQATAGGQSDAIMFVSRSLYTHMGVVEVDANGKPLVVEAVGPVRAISLEKWIEKGIGRRITVKRVKGISESDAKTAVQSARAYLGRPYDPYFYETRDAIYCSELVHLAFKDGPKMTLGVEEKVSSLAIDHLAVKQLIKQRWRKHPACQSKTTRKFDACLAVIMDQTLVTPASIARDTKLELVYSNFGPGAE